MFIQNVASLFTIIICFLCRPSVQAQLQYLSCNVLVCAHTTTSKKRKQYGIKQQPVWVCVGYNIL